MAAVGTRRGRRTLCLFSDDKRTTEIFTLSLHDALPICRHRDPLGAARDDRPVADPDRRHGDRRHPVGESARRDRKSTRLNSSHGYISYAVFCLKKKTLPYAFPVLTNPEAAVYATGSCSP